jgi:hypothetical protein
METVLNNNEPLTQQQIMARSGDDTMDLVKKLKQSLINNTTGTVKAYKTVLVIYTVAFIIGVLLIVTAIVFAGMGKTILAIAFGSLGMLDIVTYFVKLPANKIQESRSNLSQLQVVLIVWLKDIINNDALLYQYNVKSKEGISIDDYKRITDINISNTTALLKLIEDWAEPKI